MALFKRSRTHSLTGASFEVASGLRRRRLAYAIIALAVLAALGSVVLHYVEPQFGAIGRVAELERANAALRDEVEKTRVALEMEKATRGELERQLVEQNEALKRLGTELEFYRTQNGKRR